MKESIYAQMVKVGAEIDNYYSDLYVKVTPETRKIVDRAGFHTAGTFVSQIDGELWFDLPFAYEPYWESRA